MSSAVSATSLIAVRHLRRPGLPQLQGMFPGHEKTPHAGGVAVLSPGDGQHGPLRSWKARVMAPSVQARPTTVTPVSRSGGPEPDGRMRGELDVRHRRTHLHRAQVADARPAVLDRLRV